MTDRDHPDRVWSHRKSAISSTITTLYRPMDLVPYEPYQPVNLDDSSNGWQVAGDSLHLAGQEQGRDDQMVDQGKWLG